MADNDMPDWAKQLQDALEQAGREFSDVFSRAGHILTAQGAMGWAFQGEFDKARAEIANLPREQADILAMAARWLADTAQEEAARK